MALSKPQMDLHQMKLVTCPLCSEVYKSPKTLPCLHSFCERCIHDFIISIGKTKGKDNKLTSFNCPVCRTVVRPNDSSLELEKWAESLPGNISAELVISEAESKKHFCVVCERLNKTTQATHVCCQCKELLCESCGQYHRVNTTSLDHCVVSIKDAAFQTCGINFSAIQGARCFHQVKQYCGIHKELLCNICHEMNHKSCTKVTSLDDKATTDELCDSLPVNLATLKDSMEKLIKEREENKEGLRTHVQDIEKEAKVFVETVKSRLDEVFEAFRKELSVFHEEENTKINVRLRLLEQFAKTLEYWITLTSKLKGNASESQVLILFETIKSQIDTSVKEISLSLREESTINLKFEKAKILNKVEEIENIGAFVVSKGKESDQMQPVFKVCEKLGIFCFPLFENIEVNHIKQIRIPNSELRCGVSMDQHHALVGNVSDGKKLQIVNLSTGIVVNTTTFPGDVKRVCFDQDSKKLFISCYGKKLYRATVNDNMVSDPVEVFFNNDYVGGLCMIKDDVFVVVDRAIKSFSKDRDPNDKSTKMKECFRTNTECGLNGLGTYDGNLIFTTQGKELKCSTVTGENIFCYITPEISLPEGLAILPHGSVLVLDSNDKGKLHLISADGQKHRNLLEKFENVTDPRDVWLGEDQRIIYVCGGNVIDVYVIS